MREHRPPGGHTGRDVETRGLPHFRPAATPSIGRPASRARPGRSSGPDVDSRAGRLVPWPPSEGGAIGRPARGRSTTATEVARIAASPAPVPERAAILLDVLGATIPYDAAWLAVADPDTGGYTPLGGTGCDERVLEYLAGPVMAAEIELVGLARAGQALRVADSPVPVTELRTWVECLTPAGFREAVGIGLFAPDGRHVGFLALLAESARPVPVADCRWLDAVAGDLARAVDPVRELAAAARLVRGAAAGTVLTRAGGTLPLPGLPRSVLLAAGGPVLAVAADLLHTGATHAAFLAPSPTAGGLRRITVLAAPHGAAGGLSGAVTESEPGPAGGLTVRELEVLGLVVEGRTNARIATDLGVTPRTVAAHLENILDKLGVPSRAGAAARAQRDGLHVPPALRRVPR